MGFFDFLKPENEFHIHHRNGIAAFDAAFDSLPETPGLWEDLELTIKVKIRGSARDLPEYCGPDRYLMSGYASSGGEIGLVGKVVNGEIVFNSHTLGHEFNHILNYMLDRVAHPHKFKEVIK